MKLLSKVILSAIISLSSLQAGTDKKLDFEAKKEDRAAWMNEDKFGLFIHWGLYSQLERGEWIMFGNKTPVDQYSDLAKSFNPSEFDADRWVKIAKNAGMKYITITSKHHEGFALFDTEFSTYNVVDATPFKRDIIQELKIACDKEGIKLCLYYSHAMDWYHRGGMSKYSWTEPLTANDFQKYLTEVSLPQVREIVSRYKPAIIWFDTPRRMNAAIAQKFSDAVRSSNPRTLINSRLILDGNRAASTSKAEREMMRDLGVDFLSYADREIPASSPWPYWETCMTLNGAWGYNSSDNKWKSPARVIQQLIQVVSKGGTFLLNVGPDKDGVIPAEGVKVLERVGQWLKINGQAVYGAEPSLFEGPGAPTQEYLKKKSAMEKRFAKLKRKTPHLAVNMEYEWLATEKEGKVYISLFQWLGQDLKIKSFNGEVKKVYLLSNRSKELSFKVESKELHVKLPAELERELVPVICVEYK